MAFVNQTADVLTGVREFSIRRTQVTKGGMTGLNDAFTCTNILFPPLSLQFCVRPFSAHKAKDLFLGRTELEGAFTPSQSPLQIRPNRNGITTSRSDLCFFTKRSLQIRVA